jgi:hypothetical protein
MNGSTPAPADPGSGLDIFTNLFGKLNVENILPLGNGLAFLALLLAAVLIAISMIRGRTDPNTALLIRQFCYVAVFFVITTVGADVLRIFIAPPVQQQGPVTLRIAPVTMLEMDEKFPLLVGHDGEETNIFAGPYDTTLSAQRNFISINAVDVANRLATKSRMISELTKGVETSGQASQPSVLPGPAIDLGGG